MGAVQDVASVTLKKLPNDLLGSFAPDEDLEDSVLSVVLSLRTPFLFSLIPEWWDHGMQKCTPF